MEPRRLQHRHRHDNTHTHEVFVDITNIWRNASDTAKADE